MQTKKGVIIIIVLCLVLAIGTIAAINHSQKTTKIKPAATAAAGIILLELFTSEGCSSCPPADELLKKIALQYKENVIALSFHVDYWNRLGWKDPYSDASFSNRQRNYATAFGLEGVYTPQIVVNGQKEMVGSDQKKLTKTIDDYLLEHATGKISVTAESPDGKNITVNWQEAYSASSQLHIALVQQNVSTRVSRGENSGRTLIHYNVVREFKTPAQQTNSLSFLMPAGLTKNEIAIVAFLQDTKSAKITAVKKCLLL